MNYDVTQTFDGQTVKWHAPDHFDRLSAAPAMQFSNPYLGIANNPVNYVDPDGEFAIIAGLIIKKAIMAAKVAKVAKVAGTATKAAKGMKVFGGKGIKAHAKSGAINTLSSYDSDEGFGLHTFGDFAAGAIGSMAGVYTNSKLIGMGLGGALNGAFDGEGFDYEGAQSFVGGALSVWSGMGALPGEFSLYKKGTTKTLFSKAAGADKKSFFAKNADAFFKYGIQADAYNFAYTDKEKFKKQEWHQRVLIATTGGVMGAASEYAFLGNPWAESRNLSRVAQNSLRGVSGALGYGLEWGLSGWIKNRYEGGVKWGGSSRNKMWLLGGKWGYGISNFNWKP